MKYFPQRLRMARVKNGWSMQELADHLNSAVSKQAIGKYEKGSMLPERDTLFALARALQVGLDYFDRPDRISLQPEFRKLSKLSKKKQNEVIEKTRDLLERYLEAEELMAVERLFINPLKEPCLTIEDAEIAAKVFRDKMNLGTDPLHNIAELMEEWGIKVYRDHFGTDSISGLADWIEEGIAVVVINKDSNIDRQRFTALHELGHLVLNIPKDTDKKTIEYMCNRFAGAMLIPADQMRAELGDKRNNIHMKELEIIKSQYGISPQATLYRAKDLGIITSYIFGQNMRYINSVIGSKANIGFFSGTEETNRLLQILLRGMAEKTITSSKAANLNGMKLAQFRDLLETQKS